MRNSLKSLAVLGFVLAISLGVGACSLQLPGGYAEEPFFQDEYTPAP